jgi:hypothetical protein
MSERTITLAPNEILVHEHRYTQRFNEIVVHARKHFLVPGYLNWSIYRHALTPQFVTLYYKQSYVVSLREYARGKGYVERFDRTRRYPDLPTVVEAYKQDMVVKKTDRYNEEHYIVNWCQRGQTVAAIGVTLTGEEMDLLEETAQANSYEVEALVTLAVRALLKGQVPY